MVFRANPDDNQLDAGLEELLHALYAAEQQPATEQLLDYALGLAMPAEARMIEQRLASAPTVRQELRELQELDQTDVTSMVDSESPQWLRWLRIKWPDHAPLLAIPQLIPSPSPALRGTADAHTIYQAGAYRLALTIVTAASDQPNAAENAIIIQGQLINQDVPEEPCIGTVQLHSPAMAQAPNQTPQLAAETTLDEFGFFSLPNSTAGTYQLVIVLPDHTIWIQGFTVP